MAKHGHNQPQQPPKATRSDLGYLAFDRQREFHDSTAKYRLFGGADKNIPSDGPYGEALFLAARDQDLQGHRPRGLCASHVQHGFEDELLQVI